MRTAKRGPYAAAIPSTTISAATANPNPFVMGSNSAACSGEVSRFAKERIFASRGESFTPRPVSTYRARGCVPLTDRENHGLRRNWSGRLVIFRHFESVSRGSAKRDGESG